MKNAIKNAMKKVLVGGPLHRSGLALLDARDDIDCALSDNPTAEDIAAAIADAEGIVLRIAPFGADTIARAGRLKVVSRFGVGYDSVDVPALTARGIPLTVVGDVNAVTVAEITLGLMLSVTRRLPFYDRDVRAGNYHVRDPAEQVDLWRKTVLIVGFGRIGRQVAKRCAAFDMSVIVADPFAPRAAVEAAGYRYVADFRAGLGEADVITLHMPANPDGRAELGAAEFAALKPGAVLVNAARGSMVDEDALLAALDDGRLMGAGLDVLRTEPPLPDCPLLARDDVVLSPHAASMTAECMERMSITCVQNMLDGLDGCLRPEMVVNREVLE